MDCSKVGYLISTLRKEKCMTQKEIADKMNISDKTISKWERGLGCPDVSLLAELSKILGVNIEKILSGDLEENDKDGGNMKRTKFYVCKNCGNVITSTSEADLSCCGRKLDYLIAKPEDETHKISVTDMGGEYFINVDHPMHKNHFISFVAFVGYDKALIAKLYPEQNAELHIPKIQRGKLYAYCSEHGLWSKELR
ncbi:helix-turn-helix domain-containing protein [Alkalibacter mobilis]|uniref:helix-turn-helix domain-containing protein n=1 Tax=Alkalibacter mobilis TaxID=2787712 RepID=UPI00189EEC6D|nr:helix-turn-helix domain-containing protein [Alkalibacter mobilis]MBF7097566.1 helix-turn-helix domain-containing protein [Alkalibacter mobilis]